MTSNAHRRRHPLIAPARTAALVALSLVFTTVGLPAAADALFPDHTGWFEEFNNDYDWSDYGTASAEYAQYGYDQYDGADDAAPEDGDDAYYPAGDYGYDAEYAYTSYDVDYGYYAGGDGTDGDIEYADAEDEATEYGDDDYDYLGDDYLADDEYDEDAALYPTITVVAHPYEGGEVASDFDSAAAGETVTLTATAAEGFLFAGWEAVTDGVELTYDALVTDSDDDAEAVTESVATFVMPETDVEIRALFEVDPEFTISVFAYPYYGGYVATDLDEAVEGEVITLTAVAAEGFEFIGWEVLESDVELEEEVIAYAELAYGADETDSDPPVVEAEATFEMPDEDVTVRARFALRAMEPGKILVHVGAMRNLAAQVHSTTATENRGRVQSGVTDLEGAWFRLSSVAGSSNAAMHSGDFFGSEWVPPTSDYVVSNGRVDDQPWYWARSNAQGVAQFFVPIVAADAVGANSVTTVGGRAGHDGATEGSRFMIHQHATPSSTISILNGSQQLSWLDPIRTLRTGSTGAGTSSNSTPYTFLTNAVMAGVVQRSGAVAHLHPTGNSTTDSIYATNRRNLHGIPNTVGEVTATSRFMNVQGNLRNDFLTAGVLSGTGGAPTTTGGAPSSLVRTASSGRWANRLSNPAPLPVCPAGLNVAIVIDVSSSITTSMVPQMRDGARALITELATFSNTSISVVPFGWAAPATGASNNYWRRETPATATTRINNMVFANTGNNITGSGSQATNWDAAFQAVARSNNVTDAVPYDMVFFLTDGNPTVTFNYGANLYVGVQNRLYEMEQAIFSANLVKSQGSRIIAVGVGGSSLLDNTSIQNLAAVSGNQVYWWHNPSAPASAQPPEGDNAGLPGMPSNWRTFDVLAADVLRVYQPGDLASALRELGSALCSARIRVEKHVAPNTAPSNVTNLGEAGIPSGNLTDGWAITGQGLTTVNATENQTRVTGVDGDGTVLFTVPFTQLDQTRNVTITEQLSTHAGYILVTQDMKNAVCWHTGNPNSIVSLENYGTNEQPGVEFTVFALDDITCRFINRPTRDLVWDGSADATWVEDYVWDLTKGVVDAYGADADGVTFEWNQNQTGVFTYTIRVTVDGPRRTGLLIDNGSVIVGNPDGSIIQDADLPDSINVGGTMVPVTWEPITDLPPNMRAIQPVQPTGGWQATFTNVFIEHTYPFPATLPILVNGIEQGQVRLTERASVTNYFAVLTDVLNGVDIFEAFNLYADGDTAGQWTGYPAIPTGLTNIVFAEGVWTITYTRIHTAPDAPNASATFHNIAVVTPSDFDQTNPEDPDTPLEPPTGETTVVIVTPEELVVTGGGSAEFGEDYQWGLDKTVAGPGEGSDTSLTWETLPGDEGVYTYTLVVTATGPQRTALTVTGHVLIGNENPADSIEQPVMLPDYILVGSHRIDIDQDQWTLIDLPFAAAFDETVAPQTGWLFEFTETIEITNPVQTELPITVPGFADANLVIDDITRTSLAGGTATLHDSFTIGDVDFTLNLEFNAETGEVTGEVPDNVTITPAHADGTWTWTIVYTITHPAPEGNNQTATFHNVAIVTPDGTTPPPQGETTVIIRTGQPLSVVADGEGTLVRTYGWQLVKQVQDVTGSWVDFATLPADADGNADFNFRVVVRRTGFTDSDWAFTGGAAITNPNDWAVTATDITATATIGGQDFPLIASIAGEPITSAPVPGNGTTEVTLSGSFAGVNQGSIGGDVIVTISWDAAEAFSTESEAVSNTVAVDWDVDHAPVNQIVEVWDNLAGTTPAPVLLGTVNWLTSEVTTSTAPAGLRAYLVGDAAADATLVAGLADGDVVFGYTLTLAVAEGELAATTVNSAWLLPEGGDEDDTPPPPIDEDNTTQEVIRYDLALRTWVNQVLRAGEAIYTHIEGDFGTGPEYVIEYTTAATDEVDVRIGDVLVMPIVLLNQGDELAAVTEVVHYLGAGLELVAGQHGWAPSEDGTYAIFTPATPIEIVPGEFDNSVTISLLVTSEVAASAIDDAQEAFVYGFAEIAAFDGWVPAGTLREEKTEQLSIWARFTGFVTGLFARNTADDSGRWASTVNLVAVDVDSTPDRANDEVALHWLDNAILNEVVTSDLPHTDEDDHDGERIRVAFPTLLTVFQTVIGPETDPTTTGTISPLLPLTELLTPSAFAITLSDAGGADLQHSGYGEQSVLARVPVAPNATHSVTSAAASPEAEINAKYTAGRIRETAGSVHAWFENAAGELASYVYDVSGNRITAADAAATLQVPLGQHLVVELVSETALLAVRKIVLDVAYEVINNPMMTGNWGIRITAADGLVDEFHFRDAGRNFAGLLNYRANWTGFEGLPEYIKVHPGVTYTVELIKPDFVAGLTSYELIASQSQNPGLPVNETVAQTGWTLADAAPAYAGSGGGRGILGASFATMELANLYERTSRAVSATSPTGVGTAALANGNVIWQGALAAGEARVITFVSRPLAQPQLPPTGGDRVYVQPPAVIHRLPAVPVLTQTGANLIGLIAAVTLGVTGLVIVASKKKNKEEQR